jgi:hypothetical protein
MGRHVGVRGSYDHRMTADARIAQAELLYERAVFGGDSDALATADLGIDAVRRTSPCPVAA